MLLDVIDKFELQLMFPIESYELFFILHETSQFMIFHLEVYINNIHILIQGNFRN